MSVTEAQLRLLMVRCWMRCVVAALSRARQHACTFPATFILQLKRSLTLNYVHLKLQRPWGPVPPGTTLS